MVGLTVAIGTFMTMLLTSALWAGAGIAGQLLAGVGLCGGGLLLFRRMRRARRQGR